MIGYLNSYEISNSPCNEDYHFTEVVLEDLHHVPKSKTLNKIKEHLTDIYRVYIRSGLLELHFNGDQLAYTEPQILFAPYYKEKEGKKVEWRKDINFDFGDGLKVKGFAALRDPGNKNKSGFSLFRRKRLIQGSGDEGYRPSFIFRQPGDFRSLRLFGELHLSGFEVSHTKDGFRWDDNEIPFLELLKEHLDSDDLPLLKQADGYRARAPKLDLTKIAVGAIEGTTEAISETLGEILTDVAEKPPVETVVDPLPPKPVLVSREVTIDFRGEEWLIKVELTDEPSESQWLDISNQSSNGSKSEVIEIRVSLAHPFMVKFAQSNSLEVEALLRVAAALALAERLARLSGIKYSGTIRRNLNEILRDALSK